MNSLARLRQKVDRLKAEANELRLKRNIYHDSDKRRYWDARFSDVCGELRVAQESLRMFGRQWQCVSCGTIYDSDWVAYNGLRCHVECDAQLEEVKS